MAVEGETETHPNVAAVRAVPRSVVALGFVSLFMDISSEIIHSLLPVFLVTVLGAGALSVGFIEGIAEATSQVTKLFQAQSVIGSANESSSFYSATGLQP